MGIEPTLVAWEATVLPLNYARLEPRFYSGCGPLSNFVAEKAARESAPRVCRNSRPRRGAMLRSRSAAERNMTRSRRDAGGA